MNPKELALLGHRLAYELDEEEKFVDFRNPQGPCWAWLAERVRAKAADLMRLVSDIEVLKKLESSPLLSQIKELPSLAPLDERVEQFEQLNDAFVEFAHA